MSDLTVSELIKMLILSMCTVFLISVAFMMVQIQDMTTFKQNVNYTIEREGGLTAAAVTKINKDSKENFRNQFTVTSPQINKGVPYATVVEYTATQKVFVFFGKDVSFEISSNGSATSQVRKFN